MTLAHPALVRLLQQAYSAEKAAAFAYQGHAACVKPVAEKAAIRQIEEDEWHHRREVRELMHHYGIAPSRYYEIRFHLVGKLISGACYLIGRFMPFYFAGRLESGNVCEYFRMKQYFNALGIAAHDQLLYEMGIKEKEHEIYFLDRIREDRLLPLFEKLFAWGGTSSFNNIDLAQKYPVEESGHYCKKGE